MIFTHCPLCQSELTLHKDDMQFFQCEKHMPTFFCIFFLNQKLEWFGLTIVKGTYKYTTYFYENYTEVYVTRNDESYNHVNTFRIHECWFNQFDWTLAGIDKFYEHIKVLMAFS